jgi:hypothetical protein
MPRAYFPAARRAAAALSVVVGLTAVSSLARGQTSVIYDSNGFEPSFYTTGSINGQNGFASLPTPNAGLVQTGTKFAGSQAFQIAGPNLRQNLAYGHTNYWYQSFTTATGFNPVAQGKPYVQVQFKVYTSGAVPNSMDIPTAGIHLEGFTAAGDTQALAPIMVTADGAVSVFTDTATSSDNFLLTASGTLPRQAWNTLFAELNFNTQTFRVYKQGEATPLEFLSPLGGTITDVPFRNSNGPTTQIYELGMLATHTVDPFTGLATTLHPLNNVYIDDLSITASPTSLVPVPEPGLVLAAGAAGLLGLRACRRRRAA